MVKNFLSDSNRKSALVLAAFVVPLIAVTVAFISQTQLVDIDAAIAGDPTVATRTIKAPGYSDIANEDSNGLKTATDLFFRSWIGTGQTPSKSFTGLRFIGESIPADGTIVSARLELTAYQTAWIRVYAEIFGEQNPNPETFSKERPISTRPRTTAKSVLSNDVRWTAGQTYVIDVTNPVKELFDKYKSTARIALIVDGTKGRAWGRKTFYSNVAHSLAPRLVITYRSGGVISTTTATSSSPTTTSTASSTTTSVSTSSSTSPSTTATTSTTTSSVTTTTSSATTTTSANPPVGLRYSKAYDLWNPDPRWDTCSKEIHNKYVVTGPDGKIYPTWHPPVDPETGCTFGHEHGRDPRQSRIWPKIQEFYAYDANQNGVIEQSERDKAGLPFGYVNETLDEYTAANNLTYTRHEDHVGHKVEWGDSVPFHVNSGPGQVKIDTGLRCDYLSKMHQGVHSKDAFNNNLHEILYAASCTDGQEIRLSVMGKFGKVGQFQRLCDPIGDRRTIINTGFDNTNPAYPGNTGDGDRALQDRDCTYNYFLVPSGKFSPNPYEAWPVNISITSATGQTVLTGINLLFDVLDPIRYFDPSRQNRVAYFTELCYEVKPNGDRFRGGTCSGIPAGISWDDPRAPHRGLNRGVYFKPATTINNANGPQVWYTDPFGGSGRSTNFPGALKQLIVQRNLDYGRQFNGNPVPEVIIRYHAGQGVHGPN